MESFILEKTKMSTIFKKIIAFNNLDDENKELDEKTKNKLIEIKDILFDVIEEIDEAIGYGSEKEEEEEIIKIII
jgi:hypothetical protein